VVSSDLSVADCAKSIVHRPWSIADDQRLNVLYGPGDT
jgi:hypothetical protein